MTYHLNEKHKRGPFGKVVASLVVAAGLFAGAASSSSACACSEVYQVQPGDTLYSLGQQYGVTVEQLQNKNEMGHSTELAVGQELLVPPGGPVHDSPASGENNDTRSTTEYTVEQGDTLYSIATGAGMTVNEVKEANNLGSNTIYPGQSLTLESSNGSDSREENSSSPSDPSYDQYRVVSGDTLFSLADRFGTTVGELQNLNNKSTHHINVGEQLTIPGVVTAQATMVGYTDMHTIAVEIHGEERALKLGITTIFLSMQETK
ncbi:LysM peptidoglycan-binding domain-containing protein [Thalassobacillus sp. C254]|uniref:LysM peptidoglycan-binding domain-containing protein n=1 Tax=Thalassobacillus sp. C254 TaxID=1225341 RepID=UPI0006CFEE23|nr:LysM peptidoglycan-binding domain-containing protein [Thalassobacillus sp. C254]